MSDEKKRVNPSEPEELDDEALEQVAGGCEIGCSNEKSCIDMASFATDPGIITLGPPQRIVE